MHSTAEQEKLLKAFNIEHKDFSNNITRTPEYKEVGSINKSHQKSLEVSYERSYGMSMWSKYKIYFVYGVNYQKDNTIKIKILKKSISLWLYFVRFH